jgi:hypothetical protein
MNVGDLKNLLNEYPDHSPIMGQCLTPQGVWLNMPLQVGKAQGNNTIVLIQLKPLSEIEARNEKTSSQKLVDDLNASARKALKELDSRKASKDH